METNCEFCDELSGGTENTFRLNLPPEQLPTRVLAQTNHFFVIAGLGALTPGYLLILPYQHIRSAGHISSAEQFIELTDLLKKTREICEKHYRHPYMFFEHGSFSDNKPGGSCIDHAHFHAIPLSENITSILDSQFPSYEIKDLIELQNPIKSQRPYLFIEDQLKRRLIYNIPDSLPSQYLRRTWANVLNDDEKWDWGLYLETENLISTYYSLAPLFQS